MAREGELVGIMLAVVIAFAILFIGVAILHGGADNPDGQLVDEAANIETEGTGTWIDLHTAQRGENATVFDSRGNAVRLTGAGDSFVQSDQSFSFATDDNWTVSTWARVNDSAATNNMTAVSLDGRVLIQFNGSQSNWSVWYFDEGSSNSWRANVSAPDQPGNLTLVTVQHNGTHLTIHRNQTQGDVVNTSTSGSNIEPIWINSTNWHGTLDETRTWDANLTDAQRTQLHTNPIDPVVNQRTARLYYDRGRGTRVFIFWASTDATLSNGSWVDGLDGKTLDPKTGAFDITGGNDYEFDQDGPRVRALAGGELENQPVIWLTYTLFNQEERFAVEVLDAWDFAATVPEIILALFVLGLLAHLRRQR